MSPPGAPRESKAAESATLEAARSSTRAREHARGQSLGALWAGLSLWIAEPAGGTKEAPRRHQGAACYGGRSTLLVHGQQRAPHESVGPLGPLLLEHLPD